jgi:hypothetical protein
LPILLPHGEFKRAPERISGLIRRRHVIFVEGYDPQGASGFHGMFRSAARRLQRTWPFKADVGSLEIESDAFAHWTVDLAGPNWQVATRYDFLRQEQVIRANIAQPLWRQVPRALLWLGSGLLSGWMVRVWRAHWRFAAHLIYFQLLLLLWIAISVGTGWLAAIIATHVFGLSTPFAIAIAAVIAIAEFVLLRPVADRVHAIQINNHWPVMREFARGDITCFEPLIVKGAERLVAAARAHTADEIVVIGHSGGGVLAPAMMERALELDPDLGRHGPRVVLLTLGSIMPAVALFSRADRMQSIVRRLASEPSITWIDCQSRKDVMNFWNFDPVAGVGVTLTAPRHNPLVWLVRFKSVVSPEYYKRLRLSFFRLHYQFILGGDRRASYDYVLLACGPLPIATWAQAPEAALASFADDGALNDTDAVSA